MFSGSLLLGSGSLLLSSVLPASLDSSELVSLLGGGSVEVSELLLSEGGSELLVSLEVSELLGGGVLLLPVLLLPVLLLVLLELLGGGVAASFTELMAFWTSLQLPALFMAEASLSLASWVFRAASCWDRTAAPHRPASSPFPGPSRCRPASW